MRWDRLFDDLETQAASQWEAEQSVLAGESERLRIARLPLRDRLRALAGPSAAARHPRFDLDDGSSFDASVDEVGADWVTLRRLDVRCATALVPLGSIVSIGMPAARVHGSLRPIEPGRADLSARMTLGFALRELARRRAGVVVHRAGAAALGGTIDRVGADHLDLALHDGDVPRRDAAVTGYRVLPFRAVSWVQVDAGVS